MRLVRDAAALSAADSVRRVSVWHRALPPVMDRCWRRTHGTVRHPRTGTEVGGGGVRRGATGDVNMPLEMIRTRRNMLEFNETLMLICFFAQS